MKIKDIEKIELAGLITHEQKTAIIAHFKLDQESNKLLVILSIIGGILIVGGIALLVASNWANIPALIKLAGGLGLMIGFQYGGWRLRKGGTHPAIGETLHLIGSGLFLANIALVGQIYNLSSRPPNAILLWLAGICLLPWILRSKVQHILTLGAFGFWLGLELSERDSLIYFGDSDGAFIFFVVLGVAFAGIGALLLRTSYADFGPVTEKFGLLMVHISAYPVANGWLYWHEAIPSSGLIIMAIATVVAAGLMFANLKNFVWISNRQWRWTWVLALAGIIGLAWVGLTVSENSPTSALMGRSPDSWHTVQRGIAVPLIFLFCIIQIQVGILRQSPWLVNVAIVFIGLYIVTVYFELFGTMQQTGLMFLISGIALIGFAVLLEGQRRKLIRKMNNYSSV